MDTSRYTEYRPLMFSIAYRMTGSVSHAEDIVQEAFLRHRFQGFPDESDPAELAETSDSLSMAFLVLLESLAPAERAVFLLREVFGYAYQDIAGITES